MTRPNKKAHFTLGLFLLLLIFRLTIQADVELLKPVIISKLPHHLPAFTQGLSIEGDCLYESVGLYGRSGLRLINLFNGELIRKVSLPSTFFAEGIAVFPHQIIQITWKEELAFVYDRVAFNVLSTLFYSGEGWGLCRDAETVWMSNGTSTLIQREIKTFSVLKTLEVRYHGKPLENLNDLEHVGHHLYANIWHKNWIVRIDKLTGDVTAVIDLSSLLSHSEKRNLKEEEVLNGIAFRQSTNTFYVTGKEWPWIFELRFAP
ncbi:MAG: glutaminyl-peptide cyclotransferase [Parachlamydiaceae bacterium]